MRKVPPGIQSMSGCGGVRVAPGSSRAGSDIAGRGVTWQLGRSAVGRSIGGGARRSPYDLGPIGACEPTCNGGRQPLERTTRLEQPADAEVIAPAAVEIEARRHEHRAEQRVADAADRDVRLDLRR